MNETTNLLASKVDRFDQQYQWLELQSKEIILNNGVKLPQDLKLIDENNNSIHISEALDSPKLIIRYSAFACDICLERELKQLSKYVAQTRSDRILILASDHNARSLKVIEKTLPFTVKTYRIEEMEIPYEHSSNGIFVFMLDKEMTIKDFFVPEKTLPQLSDNYYQALGIKYKIFHINEKK